MADELQPMIQKVKQGTSSPKNLRRIEDIGVEAAASPNEHLFSPRSLTFQSSNICTPRPMLRTLCIKSLLWRSSSAV